jgi:serine/threonine protein kinase
LKEHGRFNEQVIKSFTAQIFDGLAYLHANSIIHRVRASPPTYTFPTHPVPPQNIEASNILVDPSGTCKISGFGNAQRADDEKASWIPMRGTVFWTAPEITRGQRGKRYGSKVDIWSAGCVLLTMWMGGKAWQDGAVFALMAVKVSHVSMSQPGVLTQNVRMSTCIDWDREHGNRPRVEARLCPCSLT